MSEWPTADQLADACTLAGHDVLDHRWVPRRAMSALLGVSERTLSRWGAQATAPPGQPFLGCVAYDLSRLVDWCQRIDKPNDFFVSLWDTVNRYGPGVGTLLFSQKEHIDVSGQTTTASPIGHSA